MTPAILLVRKAKIAHDVLSYEHDPAAESYGREAVDLLQLEPAMVFKTLVAETQAKMGESQNAAVVESDREFLGNQIQAALTDIQQKSTEFAQQAMGMISDHIAKAPPTFVMPSHPKITHIESQRVNGKLVAVPHYEDQQPQAIQ